MMRNTNTEDDQVKEKETGYKLYKRRWFMLILYSLFCVANAMQWIQYAIVSDEIMMYYNVNSSAVNWTSLVYMLTYIIFIFPATWLYDIIGLRYALILGSALNCIGAWIKVGSVNPDLFWVTLLGQTIVAIAQVYVMSTPSTVAATWFGRHEVSTACAIGVFGMQFGNTLGFVISPLLVYGDTTSEIAHGLKILFFTIAIFTTVLLILTILFMQAEPPTPPSIAQSEKIKIKKDTSVKEFFKVVKRLFKDSNYTILLIAYGINIGVFCAFMTYLNQTILDVFPELDRESAITGLIAMLCGVTGAILTGLFLDQTRTYKITCCILFALATVSLLVYSIWLNKSMEINYLYAGGSLIGFFMISYIPAGYEFGVEITYPEAESITACVLAFSTQIFAFVLTLVYDIIYQSYSSFQSNIMLVSFLLFGTLLSLFTKSNLKRQQAEKQLSGIF